MFEAVVAELLAGFGWRVNVTPPSRDGGFDILGITSDASGLQSSWLVECKRYGVGQKVGVQTIRELIGVKTHLGVPNAVLATTSEFTSGALHLSDSRHDVHLVDERRILEWLQNYQPSSELSHTLRQSFSSCFISYSSADEHFAHKLASRLRREGVPVWFAPEDILPGQKIYEQVKKAIASFDRLLVVLSSRSMASDWVRTELVAALGREKAEGRQVLFPVALVPIDTIKTWECFDADSGIDIAREIRTYHIPDFSDWAKAGVFETEVTKVLNALSDAEPVEQARKADERIDEILKVVRQLQNRPSVVLPKGSHVIGEPWPGMKPEDVEKIREARGLVQRVVALIGTVPAAVREEIETAIVRFEQRIQLFEYGELARIQFDREREKVLSLARQLETNSQPPDSTNST